jgi:hypothetical protein
MQTEKTFTKPSSRLHVILLLAILGFTLTGTAQAAQLTFSYTDPLGDQTGTIDVKKMTFVFDNTTGDYEIVLRATPANPFVGMFRVNINLFNPDTAPANSLFQDVFNDFNLAVPATELKLIGTNAVLLAWSVEHRVATNTLAGLGNPPTSSFFRTSASNFPLGFLTNEDAIAYGAAGAAMIAVFTPQNAIDLLMGEVETLLDAGLLTQNQADVLMDKLNAITAKLNQGQTNAACNQLQAFINQVNAFKNSGALPANKAQVLINAAQAIENQVGC